MGLFDLLRKPFQIIGTQTEYIDSAGALKTAHTAVKIPTQIPHPGESMRRIAAALDSPWDMFFGMRPIELFGGWVDIRTTWLVGSFIWRPVVLGEEPLRTHDLDVIFEDPEGPAAFIAQAARLLMARERHGKTVSVVENKFGSPRLVDTLTKRVLIDAWSLPAGNTIVEHISGYPWVHQRCAYLVGSVDGETTGLVRNVMFSANANRMSGD